MKISKKIIILAISVLLLLTTTVGVTLAYLSDKTSSIDNEFGKVFVTCEVQKSDSGEVSVRNTGDIDAFVRANYVVNWVDENGAVYAIAPVLGTDYDIALNTGDWQLGTDGFYYHSAAVSPSNLTETFVISLTRKTEAPSGYKLTLQIAATAIQSEPATAVNSAWGASVSDSGYLIAP